MNDELLIRRKKGQETNSLAFKTRLLRLNWKDIYIFEHEPVSRIYHFVAIDLHRLINYATTRCHTQTLTLKIHK